MSLIKVAYETYEELKKAYSQHGDTGWGTNKMKGVVKPQAGPIVNGPGKSLAPAPNASLNASSAELLKRPVFNAQKAASNLPSKLNALQKPSLINKFKNVLNKKLW